MTGKSRNFIYINKITRMRFHKLVYCMIFWAACASCSKGTTNNNNTTITVNGRLKPNSTVYTYGTNLLQVDQFTSYYVESTGLTLASFEGDSVVAVLKDMGIRHNPGPELYNVITITPLP